MSPPYLFMMRIEWIILKIPSKRLNEQTLPGVLDFPSPALSKQAYVYLYDPRLTQGGGFSRASWTDGLSGGRERGRKKFDGSKAPPHRAQLMVWRPDTGCCQSLYPQESVFSLILPHVAYARNVWWAGWRLHPGPRHNIPTSRGKK